MVQPVFVLDDGVNITEVEQPPVAIPAAEWPTYSNERFPREVAEWQARLDAMPELELPTIVEGTHVRPTT